MTMTDEAVDAQFTTFEQPAGALVPISQNTSLVRPIAPVAEIAAAIRAYEECKAGILSKDDFQDAGPGQRFVKRSGWSKLAVAFSVSTYICKGYPVLHYNEDGDCILAECKVVAVAPNGRAAEGYGACSIRESRFTATSPKWRKKSDQRPGECTGDARCPLHYAHKGDPIDSARQKLDHDLPSTAETRARNRACSNLFGNGEVSAEEVSGGGVYEPDSSYSPGPTWEEMPDSFDPPRASPNKSASANQLATIAKLSRLLGLPEEDVSTMSSATASDLITKLSRQYNETNGTAGSRRSA